MPWNAEISYNDLLLLQKAHISPTNDVLNTDTNIIKDINNMIMDYLHTPFECFRCKSLFTSNDLDIHYFCCDGSILLSCSGCKKISHVCSDTCGHNDKNTYVPFNIPYHLYNNPALGGED